MNDAPAGGLTILVAEDSAADRLILQSMLARAGHKVIAVEDGQQAVDAFACEQPDMVFLDVMMPNVNGINAAKKIKALAGGELTPVIFLTSLADVESLATCLDAGGDDFLSKPYNAVVLDSKVRAFARMREMHQTLSQQKKQIELNNQHLLQEQTVAKQVFDKIAHAGVLHLDCIRFYMSALAVFNGDVLLADIGPRGNLVVVLGDFTGHGLPAAIGSMPLASTFYGMVSKGFYLEEILREINQKLYQTLPVGLFCCAACVDIDLREMRVSVWNGGFPGCVLAGKEAGRPRAMESRHLPLGVLSPKDFKIELESASIAEGDHLYLWSDGIIEASNNSGEMFGEERVTAILNSCGGADYFYDSVIEAVQSHMGDSQKGDDISLVDVCIPSPEAINAHTPRPGHSLGNGYLADWSLSLTLDTSSLKAFNPLAMLSKILSEVPGLRPSSSMLYTVLSELFNNALEHGVLGLPSEIKSSPSGFAEFYRLRKERLGAAKDAFVRFDLVHRLDADGGTLNITVTDSGKGFTDQYLRFESELELKEKLHGRGLPIVAALCEELEVFPPGNKVAAKYRWSLDQTHE